MKYMEDVKVAVFFGGVPEAQNIKTLNEEKPHVIVSTPGRCKGLVRKGTLDLSHLKHFVLDECDKMLEETGK